MMQSVTYLEENRKFSYFSPENFVISDNISQQVELVFIVVAMCMLNFMLSLRKSRQRRFSFQKKKKPLVAQRVRRTQRRMLRGQNVSGMPTIGIDETMKFRGSYANSDMFAFILTQQYPTWQ